MDDLRFYLDLPPIASFAEAFDPSRYLMPGGRCRRGYALAVQELKKHIAEGVDSAFPWMVYEG